MAKKKAMGANPAPEPTGNLTTDRKSAELDAAKLPEAVRELVEKGMGIGQATRAVKAAASKVV